MFRIKFWGVRGSIPVPGPSTVGVGGNTSCVEVRCGATHMIFDAGTGIRGLGDSLVREAPLTAHLFFSHVHWDHIQGFPFFAPAFDKRNTIHLYGAPTVAGPVESALAGQMETPNFPVRLRELPATLEFHDLHEGQVVTLGDVKVTNAAGNHPGGVFAYRVDYQGRSMVYATDTEHFSVPDPRLVALAKKTDVLIYDTMYTPEEYAGEQGVPKTGWGHSHFVAGAELAAVAGVHRYILFHHDPAQDDAAVHRKVARAQALFANCEAAVEGLSIVL